MRSRVLKPLQPVAARPAILHVLATTAELAPAATVVVHGPGADTLLAAVRTDCAEAQFALQPEPLGTGDAARIALRALGDFQGDVIILCADVPLLAPDTLAALRDRLNESDRPALAVLGFRPDDPSGYGRLQVDEDGYLKSIVEERDATG
ncbi:MAG: NTP transferase domain-containing protein, partial [Rhodospirillales bacterium]|nr:NTP transferase domain-containing protein [Rhodospirillales bacterium]